MSNINLFQNYFPALADIPESKALDARKRLETYTQSGWPDLDMRPNTTFGDFHVTPFAYLIAGIEIAMDRFRSDLNTENAANGVIYDCDFVRQFLSNFAVTVRDNMDASGILRLVFNNEREYYLDRSTIFGVGGDTFKVYTPNDGGITVRPPGNDLRIGYNDVSLIDRGDGTFSADIPVTGAMTTQISAGDTGTMAPLIEEVISITALDNFISGTPTSSLPAQAAKSRKTIYAAANGTPGGILRFMELEFPGLVSSSVVVNGDSEMLRSSCNALGFASGCMDIYTRSGGYAFEESQTVRLDYYQSADRFMKKLTLVGQPYLIDSITDINGNIISKDWIEIYSRSSNGVRAEMAAAAYSDLEQLFLVINLPVDSNGTPLLEVVYTPSGDAYVDIIVNYRTDPLLPSIRTALTSRANKPVGVDVLVRSFLPVVFNKFAIHYTKRPGTLVQLDTARSEVLKYVNTVGYPDVFSESKLCDGIFLAGAHDVLDIEAIGELKWTVADYFLNSDDSSPIANYEACISARVKPPVITFPNIRALRGSYVDPNIGTAIQTMVSVGSRNMTYVLDAAQITFVEER